METAKDCYVNYHDPESKWDETNEIVTMLTETLPDRSRINLNLLPGARTSIKIYIEPQMFWGEYKPYEIPLAKRMVMQYAEGIRQQH